MNKWKPSFGRYDLTRGIRKRLWSAYYDFVGSTGEEGSRGDSLEGGVSPNELYSSGLTPTPTPTPTPNPWLCYYGTRLYCEDDCSVPHNFRVVKSLSELTFGYYIADSIAWEPYPIIYEVYPQEYFPCNYSNFYDFSNNVQRYEDCLTACSQLTTPTPTPPVFGSSGYQWMTINSVTSSTASGVGQNGITISIVQTGGGMGSINGMYGYPTFPETYGVPGDGTQIVNTQAGTFTATFNQPVKDALVAFASVGNPSLSVPVQVSAPFTPIWSTATTYQNPVNATQYSQFTGTEGFNIIRIDGTVSSVSFDYTRSEFYCTVCFGFVNQNVPAPTPTPT